MYRIYEKKLEYKTESILCKFLFKFYSNLHLCTHDFNGIKIRFHIEKPQTIILYLHKIKESHTHTHTSKTV